MQNNQQKVQRQQQSIWGDQKRKRAATMVGVVVGVFAASWLPIHVFHLWNRFDKNFPYNDAMYIFKICAHTLSYANCCINPFVYGYLADGFRKGLRRAFPYLARRRSGTINRHQNSRRQTQENTSALNKTLLPGTKTASARTGLTSVNEIQLEPFP